MPVSNEVLERTYAWPDERWVRLNMVVDEHGDVVGSDGTSNTLSSALDRKILKLIRASSELVIVGSRSVRTEGWHLPPRGRLAVVSRSQQLPPGCPDPSRVHIGALDEILHLATPLRRVVCEGGKSVVAALLSLNAINEICLTINFTLARDDFELPQWMLGASSAHWQCTSEIVEGSQAFTTWRRATE